MRPTEIDRDQLLTSREVGDLLQVNPSSVNKWVQEGRIRAFRTPGGHRRIRALDLVSFLSEHKMPIPRSLGFAIKRRVLMVDDDTEQIAAFEHLLKPYTDHIEVLSTTSGIDALLKIGAFQPHVIVLNVNLTEINGLEVCRRLKANLETQAIDLVLAADQVTTDLSEQALAIGVRLCLPKPIDVNVVLDVLDLPMVPLYARPPIAKPGA